MAGNGLSNAKRQMESGAAPEGGGSPRSGVLRRGFHQVAVETDNMLTSALSDLGSLFVSRGGNRPLPAKGAAGHVPPRPPGRLRGGAASEVGATKTEEAETRRRKDDLRNLILSHMMKMEMQDRSDELARERMASEAQIALLRGGPRVYDFTATMGRGGTSYHVKWRDIGRKFGRLNLRGGPGGGDAEGSGAPQSRYGEFWQRLLARLDGGDRPPSAGSTRDTRQNLHGLAARNREKPEALGFDWVPRDTKEGSGEKFVAEDFLASGDKNRSGRFGGGFLDAKKLDEWDAAKMRGLKEGDAGYAERRKAVDAMRRQIVDRGNQWLAYVGRTLMNDQERESKLKGAKPGDVVTVAGNSVRAAQGSANAVASTSMQTPVRGVSTNGQVSTITTSTGTQTIDHGSRRIVFVQPGQQGKALEDAAKHHVGTPNWVAEPTEVVIGGLKKRREMD